MEKVNFNVPINACDSHLHIIDPVFPNSGSAERHRGTVQEYNELKNRLGFTRAVFVQAKDFGLNNDCLIDAIKKFGRENSRGVAVVSDDITDDELDFLYNNGVRGFRFSLWNRQNAVVSFEMIRPLAEKITSLDMHLQLHFSPEQFLTYQDLINSLRCKIVIDHVGRISPSEGTDHPTYKLICDWLDKGKTWLKLSGAYLNSANGSPYLDTVEVAARFAMYAPERMLWGSDFPHVTETIKPSPVELLNLLGEWIPDERKRKLALVDNPEELYGF